SVDHQPERRGKGAQAEIGTHGTAAGGTRRSRAQVFWTKAKILELSPLWDGASHLGGEYPVLPLLWKKFKTRGRSIWDFLTKLKS
ncbi:hypothetical protein, partial [Intestinimonas butyriciproducens]|uniref:hypothetical protein n=1 Tax=Intestinimonas butyriciproducens TaxID=1297617 RepID=UPI00195CCAB8